MDSNQLNNILGRVLGVASNADAHTPTGIQPMLSRPMTEHEKYKCSSELVKPTTPNVDQGNPANKPATDKPATDKQPVIIDTTADNIADMSTEELTTIIQQLSLLPTTPVKPAVNPRDAFYDDMPDLVSHRWNEYSGNDRLRSTNTRYPSKQHNSFYDDSSEDFGDNITEMYSPSHRPQRHKDIDETVERIARDVSYTRHEMTGFDTRLARLENMQMRMSKDIVEIMMRARGQTLAIDRVDAATKSTKEMLASMLDLLAEIVKSVDANKTM